MLFCSPLPNKVTTCKPRDMHNDWLLSALKSPIKYCITFIIHHEQNIYENSTWSEGFLDVMGIIAHTHKKKTHVDKQYLVHSSVANQFNEVL